ncbi:hypothetical protein MP228_008264 [Amoeboaphelidium protococcarum]|nr:hypothetical protein MP228_008264 [Amoeboaphelidium protococcarum]
MIILLSIPLASSHALCLRDIIERNLKDHTQNSESLNNYFRRFQQEQCQQIYNAIDFISLGDGLNAYEMDLSQLMHLLVFEPSMATLDDQSVQLCLQPLYDAFDVLNLRQSGFDFQTPLLILSIRYVSDYTMLILDDDKKSMQLAKIIAITAPLSLKRDQQFFNSNVPPLVTSCLIDEINDKASLTRLTNIVLQDLQLDLHLGSQVISLISQKIGNDSGDYLIDTMVNALLRHRLSLARQLYGQFFSNSLRLVDNFYLMCARMVYESGKGGSLNGIIKFLSLSNHFNLLEEAEIWRVSLDSKFIAYLENDANYNFISVAYKVICQKYSSIFSNPDAIIASFDAMTTSQLMQLYNQAEFGTSVFALIPLSQQHIMVMQGTFKLELLQSVKEFHLLDFGVRFQMLLCWFMRNHRLLRPQQTRQATTGQNSMYLNVQSKFFQENNEMVGKLSSLYESQSGQLDYDLLLSDFRQCNAQVSSTREQQAYCFMLQQLLIKTNRLSSSGAPLFTT